MRFLVTVIVVIFNIQSVSAAIYYVDKSHPQANNNNPGSENEPWSTIQKAADTVQPGDLVYVKSGVYTELSNQFPATDIRGIKLQTSGTSNNPIVFSAFPGDQVIIDQQANGIGFYIQGLSHIHIKGFEIRNVRGATDFSAGIMSRSDSSHLLIEDNYIHHMDGIRGSNVAGIRLDNTTASVVRNNLVHDVTVNGQSNQNASGMTSYGMEDIIIEHNTFYNAYNGLYHKRSSGGDGALVRYNLVHDVIRGFYYDVAGTGNEPHINQRITQNLLYDVQDAIRLDASDASGTNNGFHVWNNTIQATGSSIWVENVINTTIYNNIVVQGIGKDAVRFGPSNAEVSYLNYNNYHNSEKFVFNLWANNERRYWSLASWQSGENFDQNSNVVSPSFVNLANNNFRLSQNSPLRGAGRDNVTMGAYINDNDQIGYVAVRPMAPLGTSVE